jgi:hypothetical protein
MRGRKGMETGRQVLAWGPMTPCNLAQCSTQLNGHSVWWALVRYRKDAAGFCCKPGLWGHGHGPKPLSCPTYTRERVGCTGDLSVPYPPGGCEDVLAVGTDGIDGAVVALDLTDGGEVVHVPDFDDACPAGAQ